MATPSLGAKLNVPPAPRGLVRRQRLIDRLSEGLTRRLTLVSAPPGAGKTTLLAEWAAATRLPVAWVSLDERDDEPHRFWSCVVAALGRLRPDAAPAALAGAADDALVEWVDEVILGIPTDFVLVLDDYHHVATPALHRGIAFLLDHAPATLHLAIATRKDPPFPLATLRARWQLVEIRADELSFSTEESAALLQSITGSGLSGEVVETLQKRTEGWAASVQLAGLAMRGREDPLVAARSFSGTHRYVVDYLAEEVLQRQEPEVRRFLLETSILDRLCGPVCDAVTEGSGGQATLESLERGNLFLVPLGDDRRWYRYHNLFAEFLRARLTETSPDRMAALNHRAALWLETQGDVAEAFEHWLAAGDTAAAASLAERAGRDMLNRGELRLIAGWLERLPTDAVLERPWLALYRAWSISLRGEGAAALRLLAHVESRLAGSALEGHERLALEGEATTVRAFVESRVGAPDRAHGLAVTALAQLPESARATRSIAHLTLGFSALQMNNLPAAQSGYRESYAIARESGNYPVAFSAVHFLIELVARRGRLHEAMALCEEALHPASGLNAESLPVAAEVHSDIAEILYQWNDLDGAARHAEKAVTLSRRWGLPEPIVRCQTGLALICRARGHHERARELFVEVERVMVGGRLRHVQTERLWASFRLRWWVEDGQLGRAASLAVELGLTVETAPTYLNEPVLLGLARLLLADGRADEAVHPLGRLAHSTAAEGRIGRQIEVLILSARALAELREQAAALSALRQALALAEPEGYVRLFVDEGKSLAGLLARIRGSTDARLGAFVDQLLAGFGAPTRSSLPHSDQLLEPLSRRELEILRLIAHGKTYQEIARELIVSVSTVQHHVKGLYPKLDAHSGLEAVAHARQLGLVP